MGHGPMFIAASLVAAATLLLQLFGAQASRGTLAAYAELEKHLASDSRETGGATSVEAGGVPATGEATSVKAGGIPDTGEATSVEAGGISDTSEATSVEAGGVPDIGGRTEPVPNAGTPGALLMVHSNKTDEALKKNVDNENDNCGGYCAICGGQVRVPCSKCPGKLCVKGFCWPFKYEPWQGCPCKQPLTCQGDKYPNCLPPNGGDNNGGMGNLGRNNGNCNNGR